MWHRHADRRGIGFGLRHRAGHGDVLDRYPAVLLAAFFKWTSVFILFVAAGLAAGAIRAFHEGGLWNGYQAIAFDWSQVLSTHTLFGTLLEALLGYQETPPVSEVAVYLLYLVPALILFFLLSRHSRAARRSPNKKFFISRKTSG